MATFTVEAKRTKAGQSLIDMEIQGTNAINQLKALKINIVALKTLVNTDTDFNVEDEAEVDLVITSLLAQIAEI